MGYEFGIGTHDTNVMFDVRNQVDVAVYTKGAKATADFVFCFFFVGGIW